MIETEAKLKSLLEHAEQVERSARRKALLLTLVPILFAALLLTLPNIQSICRRRDR